MSGVKYEKPVSFDAGEVASILGANCTNGDSPDGSCLIGDNVTIIPTCNSTGGNATGECRTYGQTAGQNCYDYGGAAGEWCFQNGGGAGSCTNQGSSPTFSMPR